MAELLAFTQLLLLILAAFNLIAALTNRVLLFRAGVTPDAGVPLHRTQLFTPGALMLASVLVHFLNEFTLAQPTTGNGTRLLILTWNALLLLALTWACAGALRHHPARTLAPQASETRE